MNAIEQLKGFIDDIVIWLRRNPNIDISSEKERIINVLNIIMDEEETRKIAAKKEQIRIEERIEEERKWLAEKKQIRIEDGRKRAATKESKKTVSQTGKVICENCGVPLKVKNIEKHKNKCPEGINKNVNKSYINNEAKQTKQEHLIFRTPYLVFKNQLIVKFARKLKEF